MHDTQEIKPLPLNNAQEGTGELERILQNQDRLALQAHISNHGTRYAQSLHNMIRFRFCPDSMIDDIINQFSIEDLNIADEKGNTALHYAVGFRREHVVKNLVRKGVDINALNQTNTSPVHIAASHDNIDILNFLLQNNADILLSSQSNGSSSQQTPLLTAVGAGLAQTEAIVRNLFAKKIPLNDKIAYLNHPYDYVSPLTYAAGNGFTKIV
jgi:ankyrin repeat protein